MGALGDLFESLHSAPRLDRLHGELHSWQYWQAASNWNARSGSVSVVVSGKTGTTGPSIESTYEVWLDRVGERLRMDVEDTVIVVVGDQQTFFHPQSGALLQPRQTEASWPNVLWEGQALLTIGHIADVSDTQFLGRPAWAVRVDRSRDRVFPLNPWMTGDRVEYTVDRATGVVLRYTATAADGVPLLEASWTRLVVDEPIVDAVFDTAIPDGVVPRTHSEMLYDQLVSEGIDVAGVDRTDEQAVGEAWHNSIRARRHPTPDQVLAQHLPDGPPPADAVSAEAAIVTAFASFAERDGDDLPFVEQGAGLASTLDDLAARSSYRDAFLAVTAVRFLNDHQAVAITNVIVDGSNQLLSDMLHRAVLEQGQWKLARSSLAQLLGLAGVVLPPPNAQSTRAQFAVAPNCRSALPHLGGPPDAAM